MKVEGGGHYLRAVNDGARTVSGKAKQSTFNSGYFNTKRALEYVHSEKRLHVEFLNFLSGK